MADIISDAANMPDIIPDDQFVPDDIQLADQLKTQNTQQKLDQYKELQSKYGGVGNQLLAGGAAAARGGTLGLSDLALVVSGAVDPATLKGLSEANPVTSGVGNLAGGAGLIAATGGAGALAEGAGLAGRIGASALEGGAFGAGNAISDYAMGDPSLNAQKIAAHIGTGALFGAGLGSLGEAVKVAVPAAMQKLRSSLDNMSEMVKNIPDQAVNIGRSAPESSKPFSYIENGQMKMHNPEPIDTAPLQNLPKASPGPLQDIRENAKNYMESKGLEYNPPEEYVKADTSRGKKIAAAYEQMQHNPEDPAIKEAYDALIKETLDQYQVIKDSGLKVDIIEPGMANPYPKGPSQALEDIRKGHLWTYPTESGFGTLSTETTHPLLAPTNEQIGGRQLLANDVFRIVHDYFGHAKEGNGFGPHGEENAWQAHVKMYSPEAAKAMTTETRGQNSWVNFGPHGVKNQLNKAETIYADQKAGLLPDWVMQEGIAPSKAPAMPPEAPVTPPSTSTWAAKFNEGLKSGGLSKQKPEVKVREMVKNLQDIHDSSKQAANALYEVAAPANIGQALADMPVLTAKNQATNVIESLKSVVRGKGVDEFEPISPLSSPVSTKIVNDAIEELEHNVRKAGTSYEVHNALDEFAKKIDAKKIIKFDTLPTASQSADQSVLHILRNTIRGNLRDASVWGEDAAMHYGELSDSYAAYKNSLKNFQTSFMKKTVGANGQKKFIIDPSKVSSFFNRFNDVSQDIRNSHFNEFVDQTNNLASRSENYNGFVKGAKSISDHVTSLTDKNEELIKVAQAMAKNGTAKTGLGEQGIAALVANAIGIPKPIIGAVVGAAKAYHQISNPYQMGAQLSGIFSKLKAIGEIVQKATDSIDSGAKAVFSGTVPRGMPAVLAGSMDRQYNKNSDRIQELADNPQELINHLDKTTSALHSTAPNITSGIHSNITNGIQFLNSKLPRPKNELILNPKWKATPSQKMKFNKYFGAVDDPISALKQIKNGTLSSETMEALHAVHPELLQEMQEKVMANMDSKKISKLGYTTKIALSKFLEQPLESGMLPQVIAANQAALANVPNPNIGTQNGPNTGTKSTVGGLKELDGGSRAATPINKSENRA